MTLLRFSMGAMLCLSLLITACSQNADSSPQFVFRAAPKKGIVANLAGADILEEEISRDIKIEIYELEKKLFDLKYNSLKSLLIKKLIAKEPRAQGLSAEKFLDQEVLGKIDISQKQIDNFIKERNIPKEHLNEQLLKRVKVFLTAQLKEEATDKWLAKKSRAQKIEVYLRRPDRPFFSVDVGDAPAMGGRNAKVTIVAFSDFECPYCSKGATLLKQINKKFGKKVRIAFKHFPLPFHKRAKGAAYASMCAYEQRKGAFWKLHDLMFEQQSLLDPEGIKGFAKKINLDIDKFEKCIKSGKYAPYVEKNIAEGKKIGVKSTPTFFINGRIINGAQSLEVFEEEIRQYL